MKLKKQIKELIYCFCILGLFASCGQETFDDSESLINNLVEDSYNAIDPATPKDARPYILNDGLQSKNYSAKTPPGNDWVQIWSDEFNFFDSNKWTKISSLNKSVNGRDPNLTNWGQIPENVSVSGGKLFLNSEKTSATTLTCARVESKNKFEFTFGYVEARIEISDPSLGTQMSLWLQGQNQGNIDNSGADGLEIDVFESSWTNEKTKAGVHFDGYGSYRKAVTKGYYVPGMNTGFHIYGMLWEPGKLEIYYDGLLQATFYGAAVPLVDEFLLLSSGASFGYYKDDGVTPNPHSGAGGFTGRPIGGVISSKVAYVRVWQKSTSHNYYYRIKSKTAQKWIKPYGILDDAVVQICPTTETGNASDWEIIPTSNGYFNLKNRKTNKYLSTWGTGDGSNMRQTSTLGDLAEWKFVLNDRTNQDKTEYTYFLENKASGKMISPENCTDYSDVKQITTDWSNDSQRWRIE